MNFDYLLNESQPKHRCNKDQKHCYWVPTGNIRSMIGGYVNVTLHCRNCERREELFLTAEEFKIQEKLINTQVNKEVRRAAAG